MLTGERRKFLKEVGNVLCMTLVLVEATIEMRLKAMEMFVLTQKLSEDYLNVRFAVFSIKSQNMIFSH